MHAVFYWVFNMSITAAVTGLVILLVRRFPIPKRIAVFLWGIPFLRMLLPLGLRSPYSLMSLLTKFATRTVTVAVPYLSRGESYMNFLALADSYFPLIYKVNILQGVFQTAGAVWLIGAATILLTLTVLYITTVHELRDAIHVRDNVYRSSKILSPAVYGILKPRILLPTSYGSQDNTYVLLHEKAHIRHLDNLWRILAFAVTAIHWFNPLAWVFLRSFLQDLELACDERVLVQLGQDKAKDYASALLEHREKDYLFASAFGGARIRTRIENILSFRKMTWLSATGFLLLAVAIFYILLTNS